jgi:hypothetical protein
VASSFLAGVVAGYAIAIPVGAIAVLIVELGVRRGFRVAAAAGVGAGTADGLYAALAALGCAALAAVGCSGASSSRSSRSGSALAADVGAGTARSGRRAIFPAPRRLVGQDAARATGGNSSIGSQEPSPSIPAQATR